MTSFRDPATARPAPKGAGQHQHPNGTTIIVAWHMPSASWGWQTSSKFHVVSAIYHGYLTDHSAYDAAVDSRIDL